MFWLLKPGRIGPALAILGGRPAAVVLTGGWTASLVRLARKAIAARQRPGRPAAVRPEPTAEAGR